MRRSTALRLAATAVLAGLAATACGTGAADDPANAGQTSQAAQPTAIASTPFSSRRGSTWPPGGTRTPPPTRA
ncbi:hypothetical protein [Streptomyces sp. NPDC058457]|uniref:hypothetical protein n=1 Tax=Streptomyces sp. NPDC058457 TaxID=3346507 RepID=UPI0036464BA2